MLRIIECPICIRTLKEPVNLPCGHPVCRIHESDRRDQLDEHLAEVKCPKCPNVRNVIPDKGFPVSQIVETMLRFNFDQLDLGPEYKLAVESIDELKELVEENKRLQENPELEIDREICDARSKIDLKREEAKKIIDVTALELIKKYDELGKKQKPNKFIRENLVSDESKKFVETLKIDLPLLENGMNSFRKNIDKWKKIYKIVSERNMQLRDENERIKKIIIPQELEKLRIEQKSFCQERTKPVM